MKKRSAVLIILVAILAVIILAYFIVSQNVSDNTSPSITIETSPIMIAEDDAGTIISLEYTYDGETLAFEYSYVAYKWYYTDDHSFPLEQTYVQTMASVVSSMAANRVVEETKDNFVQYGLDDPYMTVSATFQPDGEELYTRVYYVGDLNSFNNTYYFNVEGTDIVYSIASTFTPYFEYSLVDLAVYDTIPTFNVSTYNIKSVDVNGDVITDEEILNNISSAFAEIKLGDPVSYSTIETSVNVVIEYTENITVTNEEGSVSSSVPIDHTFTCRFGEGTEDGTTYLTVNDSGLVYIINSDTADKIIASFHTN